MALARDDGGNWVRIDAGYYRNPKSRAAGLKGRALDVAGICWSGDISNLTDGFIPAGQIALLAAEAEVSPRTVTVLVACGRWLVVEGGWKIHDYEKYNRLKAEVEAQRARWREKKRKPKGSMGDSPGESDREAQGDSPGESDREAQGDSPGKRDVTRRDVRSGQFSDDYDSQLRAELASSGHSPQAITYALAAARAIAKDRTDIGSRPRFLHGTAKILLTERAAEILQLMASSASTEYAIEILSSKPAPPPPRTEPDFYTDPDCPHCYGALDGLMSVEESDGTVRLHPCPCQRKDPYHLASVTDLRLRA